MMQLYLFCFDWVISNIILSCTLSLQNNWRLNPRTLQLSPNKCLPITINRNSTSMVHGFDAIDGSIGFFREFATTFLNLIEPHEGICFNLFT